MRKTAIGIAVALSTLVLSAGLALAQTGGSAAHHSPKEGSKAKEDMGSGMMGGTMGPMMHGRMMGPMGCDMMGEGMMGPMMGGGMMDHRRMMGQGMMGMGGHPMMYPERMMEGHLSMCLRNAEKLGLSDEQMERLRAVHNEQAKKLIRLRSEIEVINVDLRSELAKDSPDLSRVEALLKKREPLRADLFLEALRTRAEASGILTAEQRKELHKMMMMMDGMTEKEEP